VATGGAVPPRAKRFLAGLLIGSIPFLVMSFLLLLMHNATVFDKRIYLSDEIAHWAQPATFVAVGFDGGYYTADEALPQIETRMYAWGPGAPVFYGLLGKVIGWQAYTPVLINLAMLALGTAVLVTTVQFDRRGLVLLALLLASFAPIVMYAPMVMLQTLNQGVAMFLAAVFAVAIQRERLDGRWLAFATLVVALASLIRVSWALMFLPLYALAAIGTRSWRRGAPLLVASSLMVLASFILHVLWSAPFPNAFNRALNAASGDIVGGLRVLLDNTWRNFLLSFQGEIDQVLMRATMLIIFAFGTWLVIRAWRGGVWHSRPARLGLVLASSMLLIYGFIAAAYSMGGWKDLRVFAPVVLMCLTLLIVFRHYRFVTYLLLFGLLAYLYAAQLVVMTTLFYNDPLAEELNYDANLAEQTAAFAEAGVLYTPDADTPWCNTVLAEDVYMFQPWTLVALDDGLAYSLIIDLNPDVLRRGIQSRYVLIRDATMEKLASQVDLELLVDVGPGGLYLNRASACGVPFVPPEES
jgi:hypothetical protein